MNNLKELASLALLCIWETGKMLGFILLILISTVYLAEPALDFVIDYVFVAHLRESLIVVSVLWLGMSVALFSCVQSLKN